MRVQILFIAHKTSQSAFQMGLKGRQGRKETRSYEQIQEQHSADNLYKDPGLF